MRSISTGYQATAVLGDGRRVQIRTIRPDDRDTLLQEFHKLSPDSVRNRFFGVKLDLTPDELEYFTNVDFSNHVALVAELEDAALLRPAGVGRFVRQLEAPERAEMALTVVEALQGNGIGRILLQQLIGCARELDIRYLDATVFSDNKPMLKLLRRIGLPLEISDRGSIRNLSIRL